MKAPPFLPEETYFRVLRVATVDGISVMAVAGLLALASAGMHDLPNAAIGLLVAAAGAIELHGAGLLRAGEPRGMNWVLASQPYLMVMLLGYCAVRIMTPPEPSLQAVIAAVPGAMAEQKAAAEALARSLYAPAYAVLAVGTVVFQGGMALFYWQRRQAVIAAVEGGEEILG